MKAAVDNDILLKGACYGLLTELIGVIPCAPGEAGILGAARFVLGGRLRRGDLALQRPVPEVAAALELFYEQAEPLEPSAEEVKVAAELEFVAQQAGLPLDSGESLLCAIAVKRAGMLATGDKRAIAALEQLLPAAGLKDSLAGSVICLEQLFCRLLASMNPGAVRAMVCEERGVDRALTSCFACHSAPGAPGLWLDGLASYIGDLRKAAPTILAK